MEDPSSTIHTLLPLRRRDRKLTKHINAALQFGSHCRGPMVLLRSARRSSRIFIASSSCSLLSCTVVGHKADLVFGTFLSVKVGCELM